MISVGVLENRFVRLEPLALAHVDGLTAAATEDRSTFAFATVPRNRDEMVDYIERALAEQKNDRSVPFAINVSGRLVGSIRLMSLEWWSWSPYHEIRASGEPRKPPNPPDVAEIGHAWLARSAQRTSANSGACALLLTHAFEVWKVHRLVLKTDARNQASRAAITRLGGTLEGVLRGFQPSADGIVRDTAMFSIVPADWNGVRIRLESLLKP